ncbi:outer membrane usher protein [Pseudocitrobacter cyperus]|uniref:Outer membrane usher protein n=1 Tax=Pseudocitrobacter cyperus TaxID=3112843 RepID=A0ABV0HJF5_9ENTR
MDFNSRFRVTALAMLIGAITSGYWQVAYADDVVQFNTQFLDVKNGDRIDINRFSRKGYVLPGQYSLQVVVNKSPLADEQQITYLSDDDNPGDTYACLSPELVAKLGLKPEIVKTLQWVKEGACLKPGQLDAVEISADLTHSQLNIIIPQAYLEYTDQNWDPPARWDEGIPGLLFDYNLNGQWRHSEQSDGSDDHDISGNGTVGVNVGPWRLRADWQGNYQRDKGDDYKTSRHQWDWSRYYAFRALPQIHSQLTLGEDSLSSDIFDSFNFIGASLRSDDQMLPPNLRGYAPDVSGVAKTNAKVTISQQGRVLYEAQVPAGPFRIQDINESVSGDLHVRIEEQNGQVQEYNVSTASIPFLTRPGQVRYRMATGRPQNWDHHMRADAFASGEASWGISNGWSLYGGAIGENDYQALALGIGRDMAALGALALDVTHSSTHLPDNSAYGDGTIQGNSFRLSYAKDFDEMNSRLMFAGYRFSEENFMTMGEYLDSLEYENERTGHDKEMYTVSYNQSFQDIGVTVYLNYTRHTYWDRGTEDNYNLMISHYFDIGDFKNLSVTFTGYRNEYDDETDDGVYLSLSIPWGNDSTVSYNGAYGSSMHSNQVSYYSRLNDANNYQLSVGNNEHDASVSGYYSHKGTWADVDVSANYENNQYTSAGMTLRGGATLTAQGGALHRVVTPGGTRLLVDAEGVSDVPVSGYGAQVKTNAFGKAVISDVNSYYRSQARIDLNNMPENAEATQSVVQATLTEGAIGYRHFSVISGEKAMAVIRMRNGDFPPFGAEVKNARLQTVGLVDDDGNVYLAGVNPGERMQVSWDGAAQCEIAMPDPLPKDRFNGLFLPCQGAGQPERAPKPESLIQEQTHRQMPAPDLAANIATPTATTLAEQPRK